MLQVECSSTLSSASEQKQVLLLRSMHGQQTNRCIFVCFALDRGHLASIFHIRVKLKKNFWIIFSPFFYSIYALKKLSVPYNPLVSCHSDTRRSSVHICHLRFVSNSLFGSGNFASKRKGRSCLQRATSFDRKWVFLYFCFT